MSKAKHPFLKDIRIQTMSGVRMTKVVVLRETPEAVVYIPLNSIARLDYNRMKEIYSRCEIDMLTSLRDERLDNGRNALVVYQSLIETLQKKQAVKSEETKTVVETKTEVVAKVEQPPKAAPAKRKYVRKTQPTA